MPLGMSAFCESCVQRPLNRPWFPRHLLFGPRIEARIGGAAPSAFPRSIQNRSGHVSDREKASLSLVWLSAWAYPYTASTQGSRSTASPKSGVRKLRGTAITKWRPNAFSSFRSGGESVGRSTERVTKPEHIFAYIEMFYARTRRHSGVTPPSPVAHEKRYFLGPESGWKPWAIQLGGAEKPNWETAK